MKLGEKGIGPLRREFGRQPMGASQSTAGYDPGTLAADRFVAVLERGSDVLTMFTLDEGSHSYSECAWRRGRCAESRALCSPRCLNFTMGPSGRMR